MPTPKSFRISTDGWKLLGQDSSQILWMNETIPDVMAQRFGNFPPNDLPPDYPNIVSHRDMFEKLMTQEEGAVVSVDFLTVKNIEAFQTIFKYRMPENGLGKRFLGTLMFPFETFFCGFSFMCDEYGTTGMRESLAYMIENRGKKPEMDPNAPPPVHYDSIEEFFDRIKQSPITRNPSDDEKYDELIPNHPLSRTRRYLAKFAETIEFDGELYQIRPYRGVHKRST